MPAEQNGTFNGGPNARAGAGAGKTGAARVKEQQKKIKRENKRSAKVERAAMKRDRKRQKRGFAPKNDGSKPAKEIKIKRAPRAEITGERLDYTGGFPVYLARYVLFPGDHPRAALRFYNGSDEILTGVRFRLIERDEEGNEISSYTLERRGINAESGAEFAVADASVSVGCAFVEAELEAAYSSPYEYVVEGDGVTVRYGVGEEKREFYFRNAHTSKVKKRRKLLAVLSVLIVIVAAAVAGVTAWRTGLFGAMLPMPNEGATGATGVIGNVDEGVDKDIDLNGAGDTAYTADGARTLAGITLELVTENVEA